LIGKVINPQLKI